MSTNDEQQEAALGAVAGGVAPLGAGEPSDPLGDDEHDGLVPPGGEPEGMDAPPSGPS